MNRSQALCEELPYWEAEESPFPHLILNDGSVSSGLELLPLDIECLDEGRVNQLTLALRSFVNSLPEGITAQLLVRVDTDFKDLVQRHVELVKAPNQFLKEVDDARVRIIQDQISTEQVFRPSLFLFLKTATHKKPSAFSLSAMKRFSAEVEQGFEDRLLLLSQALEGVSSQLGSLGLSVRPLDKSALVEVLYRHLNPKRANQLPAPVVKKDHVGVDYDSTRSQLVFGDLVIDQEDFVLDRIRTKVLSLKTLPEMTFAGMMSGFLSFPFRYELLFTFQVPDQQIEMKSLEQKRRMAHSLASSTSNRVSDLESESRLGQTTDLIREIIETGQRIFHAELIVLLREADSPDGRRKLELHSKEVLSRFKTLSGSEGIQETVGSWKIFKSELPGAPVSLVRAKKLKTNNLVDFLPLYGSSAGDEIPAIVTHTRQGSLFSFNPYDPKLSNFNSLCTGSSGSGKSFASNFMMLQQIARGARVFIIDIGGSYKKMCQALGGQYFEINLTDKYAINPFELPNPAVAPSGERVKCLVSIIEQMVTDEGEKLTRFDRVQIEESLLAVFEAVRTKSPTRSPLISDFVRHCVSSPEPALQRIAKLLFPWVGDSPYGKLLDRAGQIRADRPVVAFDLKGLSQYPDLQAVMILILTNFILDQVENDRDIAKRVILDEAWELLKSPAASSFMEYAARTFRKTGSGITFITQGVEEIVQSTIGPAILNNTATKLIMLQKGDTRVLANALKLNSQELRLVQSLEQRKGVFSEGFLMEGDSRQVIRFFPTPLEYWISTSDARDNQFLATLTRKGLALEEALFQAAKEAPFGISASKVTNIHRQSVAEIGAAA
jgi:conjugal transfer ATP-binding protein TraC